MGLLKYLGSRIHNSLYDIPEIKGIRVDLVNGPIPISFFTSSDDFREVVCTDRLVSFLNNYGKRSTHLFDPFLIRTFRRKIKNIHPDFVLDLPSQPELLRQFFEDRSKLPTDRILLKYRDYVVYPLRTREALKKEPYQLMLFE